MRLKSVEAGAATLLLMMGVTAVGQTIEKMKLTDGELTCVQLYAEGTQMDTVIRASQSMQTPSPPAATAAHTMPAAARPGVDASRQDMLMAQQMMLQSRDPRVRAAASDPQSVAQYAVLLRNPQLAVAAQRAAVAGVNPALIQSQLSMAAAATQAATPHPPVAPPPAAAPVQNNLAAQAMARKEHLTGLFLRKGCRMSDIQK